MLLKPIKKNSRTLIALGIICLGIVCVLVLLNYQFYSRDEITQIQQDAQNNVLDDMADRMQSGESVYSVLRSFYPNKIVYTDSGHYAFADIDETLKMNSFDQGTFTKLSTGEITYSEDDTVISHKGIDVSKYQGDIDFSKVKAAGVEYAMIRCGYRSYGSGQLIEDSSFETYVTDALSNDLKVGVYFFTQAITEDEAREEADFVVDLIKPYNITYPVVIDVEEIANADYRQQDLSKEELTNVVIAFCEEIKSAGYTPMIYGNLKSLVGRLDLSRLESYEKWFAYYDDEPYFPYEISMWQYTESGTLDGLDGNVDFDISFKTWD